MNNSIHETLTGAFSRTAGWMAKALGSATAFILAALAVVLWLVAGPFFGYSDSWQLVVNTATTILTFLAVFLIQHSQNKDGRAVQLKLDELIRASRARNRLIDLEHCTEEELQTIEEEFAEVRRRSGSRLGTARAPAGTKTGEA